MADTNGTLVLAGGDAWIGDPSFAEQLIPKNVVVLPTAAAYEQPRRLIDAATTAFGAIGTSVEPVMVLGRRDAERVDLADTVRSAACVYLTGGSPMHLRAVLKDSVVLHALLSAWKNGAMIIGAGAGAMVLSDPMVDPRGGAFTVGFGLIRDMSVVSSVDIEVNAQLRRTLSLAPDGCPVIALGNEAALIRPSNGVWSLVGAGHSAVYLDGAVVELDVLAGKSVA